MMMDHEHTILTWFSIEDACALPELNVFRRASMGAGP